MENTRDKSLLPEISFSRISPWWHKENEIDIVAVDDDKKKYFLQNASGKTMLMRKIYFLC